MGGTAGRAAVAGLAPPPRRPGSEGSGGICVTSAEGVGVDTGELSPNPQIPVPKAPTGNSLPLLQAQKHWARRAPGAAAGFSSRSGGTQTEMPLEIEPLRALQTKQGRKEPQLNQTTGRRKERLLLRASNSEEQGPRRSVPEAGLTWAKGTSSSRVKRVGIQLVEARLSCPGARRWRGAAAGRRPAGEGPSGPSRRPVLRSPPVGSTPNGRERAFPSESQPARGAHEP